MRQAVAQDENRPLSAEDDAAGGCDGIKDGTLFYGFSHGEPLTVSASGRAARFVRIGLADNEYFHLDEVEVFAAASPETNLALDAARAVVYPRTPHRRTSNSNQNRGHDSHQNEPGIHCSHDAVKIAHRRDCVDVTSFT